MTLRFAAIARVAVLPLCLLSACTESLPESSGETGGAGGDSMSQTTSSTSSSTSVPTGGQGGSGGQGDGWGGSDWNDPDLVALAGSDQLVFRGQIVTLTGSYTWAVSDSGFECNWLQVSGEPVEIDLPDALFASFQAPDVLGPLVFRLRVKDDYGHGKSDEVTVTVIDQVPTADAGPDMGAPGGGTVTLVGGGEDADPLDVLTYSWTQVAGPPTPLDDATAMSPKLVVPPGLDEPLVYALTVHDGYLESEPDWVTVRRVEGADSDGDLVDDATEASLGLDPTEPDSDQDGLPDGWEVFGHESVDYPGLGCDPLHKDILVELDYQEYTDANGQVHSAHPSPPVLTALTSAYAALPIENPDGATGIAIHFVDDSVLPEGFVCAWVGPAWGDASPPNFLYREGFHHVNICLADPELGPAGIAEIGGRAFAMSFIEMNSDPDDDLTEETAFRLYAIFLHEMGHNLSLHHGGDEDLNYKPIYPSLMNYQFGFTIAGSPLTIADTKVSFSDGSLPTVDECAVVENGIFAGVPAEDTAYLAALGWTVAPDGSVDWNQNGAIDGAAYTEVLRTGIGVGDPSDCRPLHDFDDYAQIAKSMASSIPSDPGSLGPPSLRFKGKDKPPVAP